MRVFPRLALAAALLTYVLLVAGATVRVTGSGLACQDWPLCRGTLLPPAEADAIIDWSHRWLAALVTVVLLAVSTITLLKLGRVRAAALPAVAVLVLMGAQIGFGGVVVGLELPATAVMIHFSLAMLILGLSTWIAVWAAPQPRVLVSAGSASAALPASLARLIYTTAGLVFFLILTGAFVRASGASWACEGFPTCNGQAWPFGENRLVDIHLAHRLMAYAGAWMVGLTLYHVFKSGYRVPSLRPAAMGGMALILMEVAVGAVASTMGSTPLLQVLYVAGAAGAWACMVMLAALVARTQGLSVSVAPPQSGAAPALAADRRQIAAAYFNLTKPRVMVLLLITTLASMMVAAGGMPTLSLVLFTLLGGALASGGAGAINHYMDRDIDQFMGRTAQRPIPSGVVGPRQALIFGITLGVLAFVVLAVFVNLLSAVLSIGALLFYVFVYTGWLKRSTPSNIVIGGAAGAVPPLVGAAAVTGEVTLLALYLFAIVFFWTPPHFWALALVMRREYERAQVPMLPIVHGDDETRRQIVLYSLQLVAVTVVVFSFGLLGPFYLAAALALGGVFVYYAIRLWREGTPLAARRLFKYSILYLTLLFTAMVVDRQLIF